MTETPPLPEFVPETPFPPLSPAQQRATLLAYQCEICDSLFADSDSISRHIQEDHTQRERRTTSNRMGLPSTHPIEPQLFIVNLWQCRECPEAEATGCFHNIVRHYQTVHGDDPNLATTALQDAWLFYHPSPEPPTP